MQRVRAASRPVRPHHPAGEHVWANNACDTLRERHVPIRRLQRLPMQNAIATAAATRSSQLRQIAGQLLQHSRQLQAELLSHHRTRVPSPVAADARVQNELRSQSAPVLPTNGIDERDAGTLRCGLQVRQSTSIPILQKRAGMPE